MHPYETDYASNQFWKDLAVRVRPLIGEVKQSLGVSWMDVIETHFNRWDWLAVQMARKNGGVHHRWHVIRWNKEAIELGDDEHVAGESLEDCLAHMAMRCTEEGAWPDGLEFDGSTIRFKLGEDTLAELCPLAEEGVDLSDSVLSRIESTLLGLQFEEDKAQVFTQRMRKWKGMEGVGSEEKEASAAHFSCPSEWLKAGRHLWQAANGRTATTSEAQQLAACVLGSESWNQLCGLIKGSMNKDAWWSVSGPYLVTREEYGRGEGAGKSSLHGSFAEGFLEFTRRSTELLRKEQCKIAFSKDLAGAPMLNCASAELPGERYFDYWGRRLSISLAAVGHVEVVTEYEQKVARCMKKGREAGLRELFMIDSAGVDSLASRLSAGRQSAVSLPPLRPVSLPSSVAMVSTFPIFW